MTTRPNWPAGPSTPFAPTAASSPPALVGGAGGDLVWFGVPCGLGVGVADGTDAVPRGAPKGRAVLKEPIFFLLRTALNDRPKGQPTANRQLPSTANRHQPPTTNRDQPPTTNHQPPPTASGDQPPTANHCQPPPTTNHQPPTAANHHQPPPNASCQPPTANRGRSLLVVSVFACREVVLLCRLLAERAGSISPLAADSKGSTKALPRRAKVAHIGARRYPQV